MGKLFKNIALQHVFLPVTVAITLIAAILNGCAAPVEGKSTDEATKLAKAEEELLVPIHAEYPERKDISSYFETTTRVQAKNRVDVIAKGIGECLDVFVEEGDVVEAGQVLAELDKEELEAQIRQTRVNVEQQRVTMTIAERSLEEGIGSQIERDNARFAYEQAVATLDLQQVKVNNQIVTAPISGVVTTMHVQKGMMVSSGMPTFSIVDTSSFILPINPPEKELQNLSVGQKALVSIDSYKDKEFETTVDKINPSVDPTSGTVKVTLKFQDEAKEFLREASFARVKLVMNTHENVLVVPKDALIEENARKYVMVVRGEASEKNDAENPESITEPKLFANRVEVKTGLEDSSSIEVKEGLNDDTMIVTLGQHTLKDGARVIITNAETQILSRKDMSADEALAAAHEKKSSDSGKRHADKLLRR